MDHSHFALQGLPAGGRISHIEEDCVRFVGVPDVGAVSLQVGGLELFKPALFGEGLEECGRELVRSGEEGQVFCEVAADEELSERVL